MQQSWGSLPRTTSLYGSSCGEGQRTIGGKLTRTHLERDEPDALHSVANHEQVLDCTQGGDIHADVEECHTDESFVQIEGAHEDLDLRPQTVPVETFMKARLHTFCPMDETR